MPLSSALFRRMDQLNYSELVNKTFVVFNMKKEHALLVITSQIQKPRNTLNIWCNKC